jgi:hypothetical protein
MNHNDRAAEILATVRDRFGIGFNETMTGGGCMALEARLESGHWIVATDENLMGFARRIEAESFADNYNGHDGDDHCAMGWSIGIYPNHDDDGIDTWMNGGSDNDAIVDVVDYDVFADALPDMVQRALEQLVSSRGAR